MSQGIIRAVKDMIVSVQFDESPPGVHELLTVDKTGTHLLVDSLKQGGLAVCLTIHTDRRLQKGMAVTPTGKTVEIPVGEQMIGRVVNALGTSIDGGPPIDDTTMDHRSIFS